MGIIAKYFLKDQNERKEKLGDRFIDVLFIKEESNLVDYNLCDPLTKLIDSNVYWYMNGGEATVCVLKEYVDEAITVGNKIIIQNFSSMSAKYLDENQRESLVLDKYSVIATFDTDDVNGLSSWCNNIDHELIVKTNSKGDKCILTKEPLEFISRVKAEYQSNPFPTILNFDFLKI
jgi:exosome complex RNA-binding protein Rrp42 (RNase PH superfamily)